MFRRVVLRPENQKVEKIFSKRKSIFKTKYLIGGKCDNLIVDWGSTQNQVYDYIIDKLLLKCSLHPIPYKLAWLQNYQYVKVNKQCFINFQIGYYQDNVLCDVFPMDAYCFLLGRPC